MNDQELKSKVRELINKHDPAQLFGHGAPEDEYSAEAHLVSEFLKTSQNLSNLEIAEGLKDIFTSRFTPITVQNNLPAYTNLANDLAELLQKKD